MEINFNKLLDFIKELPDEFKTKTFKNNELIKSITMFKKSYKDVVALIEKHNDDELFTKKKYQWTGTTSLGSYFISATSSHYDWG